MKKGRKGLAMSMSFDELFKATLNMFSLDSKTAGDLSANDIRTVFKEVLKAEDLCQKEFSDRF
jgi:hypothetical protein